jgi:hypothetical protein
MLKVILFGVGSVVYIFNISLAEGLSVCWFLLTGYRYILLLFRLGYGRIGLLFLSALMLLISGFINSTPIFTTLKGVGAYALIPISVLFIVRSFSHKEIWCIFLVAQISSLYFLQNQDEEIAFNAVGLQELFKFSFSGIFVAISLTLFSFLPDISLKLRRLHLSNFFIALLISIVALWGNLRLLIFNSWLAAFLPLISNYRNRFGLKLSTLNTFYIASLLPFAVLSMSFLTGLIARISLETLRLLPVDLVSADSINKTQSQMSGDLGLLFGGRMEIFSSVIAWLEKPLLGWGSWAVDPNNYFRIRGFEIMSNLNYDVDLDKVLAFYGNIDGFLIPTHSALLNLLVWSGIAGLIPFYIFFSSYIRLFFVSSSDYPLSMPFYIAFSFASSFWGVLFSPLGFSNRTILIIAFALVISYCNYCWASFDPRAKANRLEKGAKILQESA